MSRYQRRSFGKNQGSGQLSFCEEQLFSKSAEDAVSLIREAVLPSLPIEYAPVFGVKLIRAHYVPLKDRIAIQGPGEAALLAGRFLEDCDREHSLAILLDSKGKLIGFHIVSVGDLSSAIISPREVFKAAILANASSLILAHNHPSGDPTPSPDDIAVTRRIFESGELLGIDLLDHIIIGDMGCFTSLKEKGHL